MGKYLITGRQGTGKTTVIRYLQNLGYAAYNTDEIPESTKLQNKETGEIVDWPGGVVDWSKYAWNWQEEKIDELLLSDDNVFIGAIVSNQDKFLHKFDRVFVLTVNENTLITRLDLHEHASHHLPGEKERILRSHQEKQQKLLDAGGDEVRADRMPQEIVDDILHRVELT